MAASINSAICLQKIASIMLLLAVSIDCFAQVVYENQHVELVEGTWNQTWVNPPIDHRGYYLRMNRNPPWMYTRYYGSFFGITERYPEGTSVNNELDSRFDPTVSGSLFATPTNLSSEYFIFGVRPGTLISKYYSEYDREFYIGYTRDYEADYNFFTNTEDIYVGFVTGLNKESPTSFDANSATVFGWARLELVTPDPPASFYNLLPEELFNDFFPNFKFELRLVESAIAYNSHGIVVGTTEALPTPEPSSFVFCLSALVMSFSIPRRRCHLLGS